MTKNPDKMLHFVKCDFGSAGLAFVQREPAEMDLATTIADIASGQIENVVAVYEACETGPIFRDVTEDVARTVQDIWVGQAEPLLDWQFEFIAHHVSVQAALSFRRAA